MRLTILASAALLGLLVTAGNSLALAEAVGMEASFVTATVDSTEAFAAQLGSDVQAKSLLVTTAVVALASNAPANEALAPVAAMGVEAVDGNYADAHDIVDSGYATTAAVLALELTAAQIAAQGLDGVVDTCSAQPGTCSSPEFWQAYAGTLVGA